MCNGGRKESSSTLKDIVKAFKTYSRSSFSLLTLLRETGMAS